MKQPQDHCHNRSQDTGDRSDDLTNQLGVGVGRFHASIFFVDAAIALSDFRFSRTQRLSEIHVSVEVFFIGGCEHLAKVFERTCGYPIGRIGERSKFRLEFFAIGLIPARGCIGVQVRIDLSS